MFRNIWNGGGGGMGEEGGGGEIERRIYLQVLFNNVFFTNCLLFENTKVCCSNILVTTKCFTAWKSRSFN